MSDITVKPMIFARETGSGGLEICIQKPGKPLQTEPVSEAEAALINEQCAQFVGNYVRARLLDVKV